MTTRPIAVGTAAVLLVLLAVGWFALPRLLARASRHVADEQTPEPAART